jgi:8-oxo-dGTP pyrophosphatase MutT (NUDIX family)
MRVFHAGGPLPEEITHSVFLMGPTRRARYGPAESWRGEAIRILEGLGFAGEVFVPEPSDGRWADDYSEQVAWEDAALRRADRILVWLPRDMATLPGLTTNDEWGYWKGRDPARLVLGAPPEAASVRYQQHYARQLGVPICESLAEACRLASEGCGARRAGGECQVPLHVWRTDAFQAWYAAQKHAGNKLCAANVEWVFRIHNRLVLYWALHVDVYVAVEGRHKANEVILGRPDIACVVLFRRGRDLPDTEVVLVREFRSPAQTSDGFVWEVPGGSSFRVGEEPRAIAAMELEQETGLLVVPQVLYRHEGRQVAATLSVHKAHVFSTELTEEEMAALRAREAADERYGQAAEGEVTSVRVRKVRDILTDDRVDWGTVGMILSVLQQRLPPPSDNNGGPNCPQ